MEVKLYDESVDLIPYNPEKVPILIRIINVVVCFIGFIFAFSQNN